MANFCVVDVETTGFGGQDRVIEIAIVTLDGKTLEVLDEFDTLVNPSRDVGSTNIHGISASHVTAAPMFSELAEYVASLLHGNILVAHGIAFDQRMLAQEFQRSGIEFDFGKGFCKLSETKQKLSLVAENFGLPFENAHRALADARICGQVLTLFRPKVKKFREMQLGNKVSFEFPRTLRRDALGEGHLPRKVSSFKFRFPNVSEPALAYLDALNHFLDDGHLDEYELERLNHLTEQLGIVDMREELHQYYFDLVHTAALRDENINSVEYEVLTRLAASLEITPSDLPPPGQIEIENLIEGTRVCFTGTAFLNGRHFERTELHVVAVKIGLLPVDAVSKKGCDLLVASDVATSSGKAAKARKYEIPIMDIASFIQLASSRTDL